MFAHLPKSTVAQVLGKQILRSGTSIGANYREAYRGRSKAEFIAKVGDSLRELEETGYWLELLVEGKIVTASKLEALRRKTTNSPQSSSRFSNGRKIMIHFLILPSSFFLPGPGNRRLAKCFRHVYRPISP